MDAADGAGEAAAVTEVDDDVGGVGGPGVHRPAGRDEFLDGAGAAGMQTALCVRPGNAPQPESAHPSVASFAALE